VVRPAHRHPEDRPEPADETGPWIALLVGAALAWTVLAGADRWLLTDGTLLWATVRGLHALVLAPLAAAALVQDSRLRRADGRGVGRVRWLYALVAILLPPGGALYLVHRRLVG
jgi:hypothetical protein